MGMFSPKTPNANVSMPPPSAHPSTLGSASLALVGEEARQKAAAAEGSGFDNTVGTTPLGTQQKENTAKATLLGQ